MSSKGFYKLNLKYVILFLLLSLNYSIYLKLNNIIMSSSEPESNSESNSISNSESFVNQITLQYLMNKSQYTNYMEKKTSESISKRERKFYSQRFIKLTKKLLFKRKSVEDMPGDIKFGFESFLKSCIHHFKMTDHTEIVQAEYDKEGEEGQVEEEEGQVEEEEEKELIEGEELIEEEEELSEEQIKESEMRSLKVKMENMYLDNFVKKTPIDIFIPHTKNKKNLNKLRKKKNIDNNYEETKNEKVV